MSIGPNGVDYTALQAKWPTLAPGTTAQKLAALNAEIVTGAVPVTITLAGKQIWDAVVGSEWLALTAVQQQLVRDVFLQPSVTIGTGTIAQTVMQGAFNSGSTTRANLLALIKGTSTLWWQANGYTAPINTNDLVAAGGLT